eukprot:1324068-Rhodomonas_salina.1
MSCSPLVRGIRGVLILAAAFFVQSDALFPNPSRDGFSFPRLSGGDAGLYVRATFDDVFEHLMKDEANRNSLLSALLDKNVASSEPLTHQVAPFRSSNETVSKQRRLVLDLACKTEFGNVHVELQVVPPGLVSWDIR